MAAYEGSPAIQDVLDERTRQDAKWGEQNHDPSLWLTILGEEFGETCQAALEAKFGKDPARREERIARVREEAVQTAAVALAMVECIDRGQWAWSIPVSKE
jgi:hypothetical protein